jgi:hypothetical protein
MDKRFEHKEYWEIEYGDFDELASEVLGVEYECVAENEWNNYSSYDFPIKMPSIDPEGYFMQYTLRDVERRIEGTKTKLSASDILEYMRYKNLIPDGNYLITVFW